MIDAVPTGDLGLDVLLGGGFRLVTKLQDKASATVLVRGGAGAGKTLVGLQAARALAAALGGDVVVGCVEILPSEYVAQVGSARPDINPASVAVLPGRASSPVGPRVFCGLLVDLDPASPDLVASLEALGRDVADAGGRPAVFLVDSLIEGYGIGATAPRTSADAVMKLAAQGGYGLVLCEEVQGDGVSPWVFAADTVLELGVEARERGRWIEVRKHRFGPSVSGRHELDLGGQAVPAVYPDPHAWVAPHARTVMQRYGLRYIDGRGTVPLVWREATDANLDPIEGAFVLVTAPDVSVARGVAASLMPTDDPAAAALFLELDPLIHSDEAWIGGANDVRHVPTVHGPARALRWLVEQVARVSDRPEDWQGPRVRRVLLGDLAPILEAPDALRWVEAVRVFASLVIDADLGSPLIAYSARATPAQSPAWSLLGTIPDACVNIPGDGVVTITERWRIRRPATAPLPGWDALPKCLPQLPRPRGRGTDRR